ncbi:MAG: winged helix-turn-helix domain-containing protein [Acidobacteria bacterium]|nr:winged helix-turn-helix domain-containing protein [Acidobacteriota bacterium]
MDIQPQVGETAGRVWELLSSEGPQTLAQLKKKLKGSGDVLSFAIGWLAREDKIDLSAEKKTLRVQLK